MSQLNFDARAVAPATGQMDPIPAGWYEAVMDQSEMKPTKDYANTGNMFLECRFNIASGQYANRKLYTRLNLKNNNPVAAEIAQKELSAICHAVNVLMVQDSQQLHGIPMKVKVKLRAADGQYEASNEITAFRDMSFVPDAVPGATAAQRPAQQFTPPPQQQPQFAPPQQQPAFQQPQAQNWAGGNAAPQPWQQPQQQAPQAAQPQQPPQQYQQPQQPPQQPQFQQPPAQQPTWSAAPQGQMQQPPAQQAAQPGALPPSQPWAPGQNPQEANPPWVRNS
jgi:hypothetical protein